MNKEQRKSISEINGQLEDLKQRIEGLRDGEQEKYENLSEGLQATERGMKLEAAADNLGNAFDMLQDVIDALEEAAEN